MRYGVPKTTIEDVIRAAGVSRATLYKYVPGGKNELIVEVTVRECERHIDQIRSAMQGSEDLEGRIATGVLAGVARIRDDDHLRFLYSNEILDRDRGIPGAAEAMIRGTRDFMQPVIEQARADGSVPDDLSDDDIAEWLVRMVLSLLSFEGQPGRSAEQMHEYVKTFAVRPLLRGTN